MIVTEAFKGALYHRILKKYWRLKDRNAARMCVPKSKMPAPPDDVLIQSNQARGYAGNGLLC